MAWWWPIFESPSSFQKMNIRKRLSYVWRKTSLYLCTLTNLRIKVVALSSHGRLLSAVAKLKVVTYEMSILRPNWLTFILYDCLAKFNLHSCRSFGAVPCAHKCRRNSQKITLQCAYFAVVSVIVPKYPPCFVVPAILFQRCKQVIIARGRNPAFSHA
jgi:hypothetical protein